MRTLSGDVPADVMAAAALLRAGQLVAFPTETVYGLGGNGLDETVVQRIFAAKGRPQDNPVILHVASFEAALPLWAPSPGQLAHAQRCAEALWPGPLTLVLPASPDVPPAVTAGLRSVGVRVPKHPVALALLRSVALPIAAPSANRSGRPSPTTAAHVLRTLDKDVAAVVDGGATEVGLESTVLDLTRDVPTVLRPGGVSIDELRALLGDVAWLGRGDVPEEAASPGLRHRHYAPAIAAVQLAPLDACADAWLQDHALLMLESSAASLQREFGPRAAPLVCLPDEPEAYGRGLYDALYRLEETAAAHLMIEAPPRGEGWRAVQDRVRRAAGDPQEFE
ncbi:MAG: L-threonylcarbamoyladenylate synthase [Myxococcota bacterium]